MSLSEGKMFTIEALNRIEGFVWPVGAGCAAFDCDVKDVGFYTPSVVGMFDDKKWLKKWLELSVSVGLAHPDWRNSLITREEFESVDGWVRNDGKPPVDDDAIVETIVNGEVDSRPFPADGIEWGGGGCVSHWRYHKPQKQEVKPEPESIETMIRRYKDAKENKRAAIDKLNQAQADVEQAEALEDSLFMAIEAWAESHGFDIRVLSESEEKPELVITDWRDLQEGDVIECIEPLGGRIKPGEVGVIEIISGGTLFADFDSQSGYAFPRNRLNHNFKFIRRPEKK